MKPANFPAAVERRRVRAEMPKKAKTEPEIDQAFRAIRTKKFRGKRRVPRVA